MLFAEQQLWGRNSRQAAITLGDVDPGAHSSTPLQPPQRLAIEFILQHVLAGPPKTVSLQSRPRFHLWIDGSCKWPNHSPYPTCGLGAAILTPAGWESWGLQLDPSFTQPWSQRARKSHLIFEAELLPYLLSLTLWHDRLRRADLLVFIDNDAARTALTKAFSRRAEGAHLVGASVTLEEELQVRAAFLRVPTHSNIADGPRRDDFSIVDSLGVRQRQIPHVVVREVLRLNECGSGGNSSYEALGGVYRVGTSSSVSP